MGDFQKRLLIPEKEESIKITQNNSVLIFWGIIWVREKLLRGFQDSVILRCNNEEHF